jgi:hypothetical protein
MTMKTIYMTLAAVSALAAAAPVAAQSWQGNRSNVARLQMQLDTGVRRGEITRREAMPLRASLDQLVRMERHFSAGGFSRSERNTLQMRSAGLDRMIDRAAQNGNRTAGWSRDDRRDFARDDRREYGGKDGFAMADRRDDRGDRFSGDVRIGQRFNDRQVALPMQYRARYQDSDASYYRYDDDRIYQIDRRSGLILAMFQILG